MIVNFPELHGEAVELWHVASGSGLFLLPAACGSGEMSWSYFYWGDFLGFFRQIHVCEAIARKFGARKPRQR